VLRKDRLAVVWLGGGLGNQLFQYAFGRALAITTGASIWFDPQYFRHPRARPYVLPLLGVKPRLVRSAPEFLSDGATVRVPVPLRFAPAWLPAVRSLHLFNEKKSFSFDPEAFQARGRTYFLGYWQAYAYLAGFRDPIAGEIRLPVELLEATARAWLDRIRNSEAVAVHVRRGDYLNPHTSSFHGLCDRPYYLAALGLVRERAPGAVFYVFSEDPDWCRAAFAGEPAVHVVDCHTAETGHLDLALMAACRHHIIANSSFSWWGAWLARRPGQIVIAPTPWTTRFGPVPELLPPDCVVLDRESGAFADPSGAPA
jgi:hypothetical protein